jgi:citrate synthase
MVEAMVQDLKVTTDDWTDKDQVANYLRNILAKNAFDHTGLIYGMGHAVYTTSDPRAVLLKDKAKQMALQKGFIDDFNLLSNIEAITKDLINEKHPGSEICANVDLYTGLVYRMLGISPDLYTPIFAVARTAGWCAHRLEQIQDQKIIRPAYVNISEDKEYLPMEDRLSNYTSTSINSSIAN